MLVITLEAVLGITVELGVTYYMFNCLQAIEDLSKALEFEPNSADILHERGNLLEPSLYLFNCHERLKGFNLFSLG